MVNTQRKRIQAALVFQESLEGLTENLKVLYNFLSHCKKVSQWEAFVNCKEGQHINNRYYMFDKFYYAMPELLAIYKGLA